MHAVPRVSAQANSPTFGVDPLDELKETSGGHKETIKPEEKGPATPDPLANPQEASTLQLREKMA